MLQYIVSDLTLNPHKTKIVEFANSVDPDEMAHHWPPHLGLYWFALKFLDSQYDAALIDNYFLICRGHFFICFFSALRVKVYSYTSKGNHSDPVESSYLDKTS